MKATLRLLPDDLEVPVRDGEAILGAICRAGLTYRYGCRRGGCGTCKADLVSGAVAYRKTVAGSVLSQQELAAGVVLTCRAEAGSEEIVLRLRSQLKLCVPIAFAAAQREAESAAAQRNSYPTNCPPNSSV